MSILNTFARALLLALALLPATQALAHNKLTATAPADGAVLAASPAVVELGFADATYLEAVTLQTADGVALALDFEPPAELASGFSIPLPALAPGYYRFHWKIEGTDTHVLEGELSFTVEEVAP